MYNDTGERQLDQSVVLVCTVPAEERANIAELTVLGTEDLGGLRGMEPGEHVFSGDCVVAGEGDGAVTLLSLEPHLRGFGTGAMVESVRVDGSELTLLNAPFSVEDQVSFDLQPGVTLFPGERLTTTCLYNNTSDQSVALGHSRHTELCYVLALAYPAGSIIDRPSVSLIGAQNVCMGI